MSLIEKVTNFCCYFVQATEGARREDDWGGGCPACWGVGGEACWGRTGEAKGRDRGWGLAASWRGQAHHGTSDAQWTRVAAAGRAWSSKAQGGKLIPFISLGDALACLTSNLATTKRGWKEVGFQRVPDRFSSYGNISVCPFCQVRLPGKRGIVWLHMDWIFFFFSMI